eukprot:6828317-Prymnesium_polylepis.1
MNLQSAQQHLGPPPQAPRAEHPERPRGASRIENRNVKALTLLKCYNITTEQHWDPIPTTK